MKASSIYLRTAIIAGFPVLVLSGCGGGGSSNEVSDREVAPTSKTIGGVVAKGPLKNAKVTAYCGATTTVLGTANTDSTGNYAISYTAACAQPIKLEVTAQSGTKMIDEIKGEIDSPSDFSMKAYIETASSANIQNITPLTNAVAQIAEAGGSVSAAKIRGAQQTFIANVLGGDASAYAAKPVTGTELASGSDDQKRLATLLTAVSVMAQIDASCTGTDGAKIKCATDNLARLSASAITASDTGAVVNADDTKANASALALLGAANQIAAKIAENKTSATVNTSNLSIASVATNLNAATAIAAGSTGQTVSIAVLDGIQAGKAFVKSLRADAETVNKGLEPLMNATQADWGKNVVGGNGSLGDVIADSQAAVAVWEFLNLDSSQPLSTNESIFSASVAIGSGKHLFSNDGNYFVLKTSATMALFLDTNSNCGAYVPQGTKSVSKIYCPKQLSQTQYSYFALSSNSYDSTSHLAAFEYKAFNGATPTVLKLSTNPWPTTSTANNSAPFSGTLTVTGLGTSAGASKIILIGDMKPFSSTAAKSTADLTIEKTESSTTDSIKASGSVKNLSADGSTLATLAISNGSVTVTSPASADSLPMVEGNFPVQVKTATHQFDGSFTGMSSSSKKVSFIGSVSAVSGATTSKFFEGKIEADAGTNAFGMSGTVTVSNMAYVLSLNIASTAATSSTGAYSTLSLNYLKAGSTMFQATGKVFDLAQYEAGNSANFTSGDGKVKIAITNTSQTVSYGDTNIAQIVDGQVNFADGTYVLLGDTSLNFGVSGESATTAPITTPGG